MSSPNSPAASIGARRIWTPAEDELLKSLVDRLGDARGPQGRWKDISAGVPGRTAKDCRKRWFHSLDPSLRKGRWTEEEDRTLLQAYDRLGPAWYIIAKMIPGRKDDQCAKRYNDILGPSAKDRLSNWSPAEDDILRQGVSTLGNRWSAISRRLPGRPPLTCRNRWRALSKEQGKSSGGNQSSPSTTRDPISSETDSPREQCPRSGDFLSQIPTPSAIGISTGSCDLDEDAYPMSLDAPWADSPPTPPDGSLENQTATQSYLAFHMPDHSSDHASVSDMSIGVSPGTVLSGLMPSGSREEDSLEGQDLNEARRVAVPNGNDVGGMDHLPPRFLDHMHIPVSMGFGPSSLELPVSMQQPFHPIPEIPEAPRRQPMVGDNDLSSIGMSNNDMASYFRGTLPQARSDLQTTLRTSRRTRSSQRHNRPYPPQATHAGHNYEAEGEQMIRSQQLSLEANGEVHIHHHVHHHHHHYHHHDP